METNIDSVDQLEILRVLGEDPKKEWSAPELARETRDRLFALAFFVLAVNRIGLILAARHEVKGDYLYWVRLVAFFLILLAIVDKNRAQRSSCF